MRTGLVEQTGFDSKRWGGGGCRGFMRTGLVEQGRMC